MDSLMPNDQGNSLNDGRYYAYARAHGTLAMLEACADAVELGGDCVISVGIRQAVKDLRTSLEALR